MLALRQWGEEWGYGNMCVVLADKRDCKPVRKICVQAQDGRPLQLSELTWVDREQVAGAGLPDRSRVTLFDLQHVVAQRARIVQRIMRHLAVGRGTEARKLDQPERQRRDFDRQAGADD